MQIRYQHSGHRGFLFGKTCLNIQPDKLLLIFTGSIAREAFKDPVEIGKVIESALETNLRNR